MAEKIIEFEGRRMSFPSDATDDEIAEALSTMEPSSPPQQYGSPEAASPSMPQPITQAPNRTMRNLTLGTQAVGKGLADIVGMVPDLSNAAANIVLSGADLASRPFGGKVDFRFGPSPLGSDSLSEAVSNVVEAAGVPLYTPDNPQEKLLYNVARYGTQGAATGAGLTRAGMAMSPSSAPRMSDAFIKPYAQSPGRMIGGDTAAGAGSGAFLTASQAMPAETRDALGGTVGPIADFVSMIGGGIVGANAFGALADGPTTVARIMNAKRPSPLDFDPVTGQPFSNRAAEKAAEIVQSKTVDPATAIQNIDAAVSQYQGQGLPMPTTGLISGDTGALNLELGLRSKLGGGSLAEGVGVDPAVQKRYSFVERDNALNNAALEQLNKLKPEGANPALVQQAAIEEAQRLRAATRAEGEAAIAERQARIDTVEGRAQNVQGIRNADAASIEPYRSVAAGEEASKRLDDVLVNQTYLPDRNNKNALYNAVDPNRTEMVDATPLTDAATRVREGVNALGPQGQQLPAEFIKKIEALSPETQVASSILNADGSPMVATVPADKVAVGDIVDLQKYTSKAREAARASGNFDLADNISELRKGANQTIENSPAAQEANTNYRENFAPKYRAGPGDEMAKFTKDIDRDSTRSTTPPTKTASRFLSSQEKTESLKRVLDASPAGAEGNAAVRDYLLSDMAMSGVIDQRSGVLRPDRIRAWKNKYGGQLNSAPEFLSEVDSMIARAAKGERVSDGLAKQIKEAQMKLKEAERAAGRSDIETERMISKGALAAVIDSDPDKYMFSLMSDPNTAPQKMKGLMKLVGANADLQDAVKYSLADYIIQKASTNAPEGVGEGTRRISASKLDNEIELNRKAIAEAYTPEEMNNIQQSKNLVAPLDKKRQQATSGSPTDERGKDTVWSRAKGTFEVGAKLYLGMLKGGGVTRTVDQIAQKLDDGSDAAAERLVAMSVFDHKLKKQLLSLKLPKGAEPTNNVEVGKLLRKGELARQNTEDEKKKEPLSFTVTPSRK